MRCVTRHGHSEHTSHFVPTFCFMGTASSLPSLFRSNRFLQPQSILPLLSRPVLVVQRTKNAGVMWIEPKETSGSLSLIHFFTFLFQLYYPPPHTLCTHCLVVGIEMLYMCPWCMLGGQWTGWEEVKRKRYFVLQRHYSADKPIERLVFGFRSLVSRSPYTFLFHACARTPHTPHTPHTRVKASCRALRWVLVIDATVQTTALPHHRQRAAILRHRVGRQPQRGPCAGPRPLLFSNDGR